MFRRGDSLLCSVEATCRAHPLTSKVPWLQRMFFQMYHPPKMAGKEAEDQSFTKSPQEVAPTLEPCQFSWDHPEVKMTCWTSDGVRFSEL